MTPTIKVYVDTEDGPAIIASLQEWNTPGPYTVAGLGATIARDWIENEHGAFGYILDQKAAPCDLHCAAMALRAKPDDNIRFVRVEGLPQEYNSGLAEGEKP